MRIVTCWALGLALAIGSGCGSQAQDDEDEDEETEGDGHELRIGALMMETGRRFELSGRAAVNGRWELSAYEAEEIAELFDSDMDNAGLPARANKPLALQMQGQLEDQRLPALRHAAETRDANAYAIAFRETAATCNGCHAASGNPFVQVPIVPGSAVPDIDPPQPTPPAPEAPPEGPAPEAPAH